MKTFLVFAVLFFSCSTEEPLKIPKLAIIENIVITSFSQNRDNGQQWDILDGPDITITLEKGTEVVFIHPGVFENAVTPGSYLFDVNFALDSITELKLLLYDVDSFSGNEFMNGILFTVWTEDLSTQLEFNIGEFSGSIQLRFEY